MPAPGAGCQQVISLQLIWLFIMLLFCQLHAITRFISCLVVYDLISDVLMGKRYAYVSELLEFGLATEPE